MPRLNGRRFTLNMPSAALARATVSIAAVVGFSSYVSAQDFAVVGQGADISAMCGTKPIVLGLAEGFGGNTWRKIQLAELRGEASKCANITNVVYANANGDQQKGNSNINSLVAQGVNVLLSFTDFGDAQIPAYRSSTRANVTVVPYFSKIGGTAGRDYTANVYQDQYRIGQTWAEWLGVNLKTGNVLFLGGTAGAASSQRFMDGFKSGLQKYPDLKLLDDKYIVTNWNPADAQKAVAGLIAKHPKIDGIATDYGVTTLAAIKAFQQAGLPVPAQATLASNNELNCKYLNEKQAGRAWPYFSLDGTTMTVRFALRRALAAHQGTPNSEPLAVMPYPYIDSAKGLDPKCDPSAPPDADLSSGLPQDQLKAIFSQ